MRLRPHLEAILDVSHGGLNQLVRQGVDPTTLLDFSATVLPGGPLGVVREALAQVRLEQYPDPHAWNLRMALACHLGIDPHEVLPANGSVELIRAVALATLEPHDRVLILGPTFGEYAQGVRIAGGVPIELRTETLAEVLSELEATRPTLLYVCNPNNPTGHRWTAEDLARMEESCPLVLDEAYAGFLAVRPPLVLSTRRITLRSMTKDFALAGLRLGYAIAPAGALDVLARVLTPWGVNSLAQAAGIAALAAQTDVRQRIQALHADREELIRGLRQRNWRVDAREAPYFLVDVGDGTRMYQSLLEAGIVVRNATSFGLPTQIRLSPRGARDHERLLDALDALPKEER